MPTFPEVRLGESVRHESLTVVPLFAPAAGAADYLLADEALASGAATVEEVGEGGSVPTLVVDNKADRLVLFLEGEELRGAKQNRILNTSVLAPARARSPIPVSCVEQGRWRYQSRHFGHGGSHASPKMRQVLKASVSRSAGEGLGHGSDQGAVWKEVGRQMASLGSKSETMAMADTFEAHRPRLDEFRERLAYPEGAVGLAVVVGGKVVSLDLFDKPATCRKVWDRLLSGTVMEALESKPAEGRPVGDEVAALLAHLRAAPWRQTPAAGAGEEVRSDTEDGRHASALVLDGAVVHGSVVVAG